MEHPCVADFAEWFSGNANAYGLYTLSGRADSSGKQGGRAETKVGEVTLELWSKHLLGKAGLGIVPINAENKSKFGVIDIDIYDKDLKEWNQLIQDLKLPLILFRSKSGGAHLYLFVTEPVPSKLMREKLADMATQLGQGGDEIFPKQNEILAERGDVGNWINMPYFDDRNTLRYAMDATGRGLSSIEAINYIKEMALTPEELLDFEIEKPEEILQGAPPCLNAILAQGIRTGTRNKVLFNLGVYAQKAHEESWQSKVEEYASRFLDGSLRPSEVQTTVKSLGNKKYMYTCKEEPLLGHCNKEACKRCEFGVGGGGGLPPLSGLTKFESEPPVWFLEVSGARIELSTEELQTPRLFQRKCMNTLNVMPPTVKGDVWQGIVQALLADLNIVEMPDNLSPRGRMLEHLDSFLHSVLVTDRKEDILGGKIYQQGSNFIFRMGDFMSWLEHQKFRELTPSKVGTIFKEEGMEYKNMRVGDRFVNVWIADRVTCEDTLDTPTRYTDDTEEI